MKMIHQVAMNTLITVMFLGLAGCSGMSKETAIGAGAGALGGAVLTGGSTAGTIGGAVVGGAIGHEVGK